MIQDQLILIFAKWIVVLFGVFLIFSGVIMLIRPQTARSLLRKAGSTNLINYSEITIRMIPAIGLILSAQQAKYPDFFKILGGFMLLTSLVLYFVPRSWHHNYSLRWANVLTPFIFQLISPFSILFGAIIIYCVF